MVESSEFTVLEEEGLGGGHVLVYVIKFDCTDRMVRNFIGKKKGQ